MGSVDDIVKIKKEVEQDLLKIPGVNTVAVGNKIKDGKKQDEVAIRVYVSKKRRKDDIPENERIPERVKGISTDIVEGGRPVIAHGQPGVDTTIHPKLMGGINVGPIEMTGTLGAIAIDNDDGQAVILSCAHVFAPKITTWSPNAPINNPANNPGHVVASLKKVNIQDMDAAIATINDPHGYVCKMVDDRIGPITGSLTDAEVHNMQNQPVKKVGARTGFTTGIIETVSHSVTGKYDNGAVLLELSNQIGIRSDSGTPFSEEGDSGSCIVNSSGKIVGLLIGASEDEGLSFATPIERVIMPQGLNITICPS